MDFLESRAERFGDRTAVTCDGQSITYRDLYVRSCMLARGLLACGIAAGDRVALWAPNLIAWVECRFATAAMGALLVPINTRFLTGELRQVLSHSGSRLLFMNAQVGKHSLLERLLEDALAALPPNIETVFTDHAPAHPRFEEWATLYLPPSAALDEELAERRRSVTPDAVCTIQYTSGSSGDPKGALLTQAALVRQANDFARILDLDQEDRFYTSNPFFHVGAGSLLLPTVLAAGAQLMTCEVFDPVESLSVLESARCTAIYVTLTAYQRMLQSGVDQYDLSALGKGWVATTDPSVARMVYEGFGIDGLTCMYGLSEAGAVATLPATAPLEDRLGSQGRPLPGIEVRIVDGQRSELPPDTEGEIAVRGYSIAQGYNDDAGGSVPSLDSEGWFYTGDLGRIDARGLLHLTGRLSDIVRVGGENVAAAEVERVLRGHPAVVEAAVVPKPDQRLGEVCWAFVQAASSDTMLADDLVQHCREHLAGFKVPRGVTFVTEWPTTGPGKIAKRELAAQLTTSGATS